MRGGGGCFRRGPVIGGGGRGGYRRIWRRILVNKQRVLFVNVLWCPGGDWGLSLGGRGGGGGLGCWAVWIVHLNIYGRGDVLAC